jgi:chitin-binding protein
MELELTIGDKPNGKVRWVLRDGTRTVTDVTKSGLDTWVEDRVRPKWGIYRSLGDTSGSLQDCFLLTRAMRAFQLV